MKELNHRNQQKSADHTQSEIHIYWSLNPLRHHLPARVNPAANGVHRASWRTVTVHIERSRSDAPRRREGLRAYFRKDVKPEEVQFEPDDIRRLEKQKNRNRKIANAFRWEFVFSEEAYEQRYEEDKAEALRALETSDLETFYFHLLFYGPRLLTEPSVSARVQEWWWAKGQDREAKENLKDLCDALLWGGRDGRPPELTEHNKEESRRKAVSLANAVKARLKWYQEYKGQGRDAAAAYQLAVEKHTASTHIKDPIRKTTILQQFRRAAIEIDPSLQTTPSAQPPSRKP